MPDPFSYLNELNDPQKPYAWEMELPNLQLVDAELQTPFTRIISVSVPAIKMISTEQWLYGVRTKYPVQVQYDNTFKVEFVEDTQRQGYKYFLQWLELCGFVQRDEGFRVGFANEGDFVFLGEGGKPTPKQNVLLSLKTTGGIFGGFSGKPWLTFVFVGVYPESIESVFLDRRVVLSKQLSFFDYDVNFSYDYFLIKMGESE